MPDTIHRLNTALQGRYAIERELGEGGMATVYLAADERHDRRVAIKVLRPELAAVVGAERFLAEIRTIANLQHPHILPLHDSGEADGLLYYVMPYVEGESLRDRLDRERQLGVDEAVRLAVDIAEALDYAHRQGVIHRDIKPANILLHEGRPLIADFGIAKAVSSIGAGRLTETGLSLGTPSYMSPEQAAGDREVSAATDTYSLACVLYEMLVGEPPFTGPTAQAILARILSSEPASATAVRKAVPVNVEAAISRALERLPADRFADTKEFAAALTDPGYRYGPAGVAAPFESTGRWRNGAIAAIASLAIVSAIALWGWLRPTRTPQPSRYVLGQSPEEAMVPSSGPSVALSPDGSRLVYVGAGEDAGQALWVKERSEANARRIPGTDGARNPFFFPDGERVGFLVRIAATRFAARSVSIESGALITLADSGFYAFGASAGPDGTVYVMSSDGNLVRLRDGSREPEPVTAVAEGSHRFPDALPGGRGVLFTAASGSFHFENANIAVVDLGTGEYHVLVENAAFARYASTGHLVYVRRDGTMLAAPFDERELRVTGEAFPLGGVAAVGESNSPGFGVDLALSRSGTLVYTSAETARANARRLAWVTRDGTIQEIDPEWTAGFEGVVLSPDETRLAVAIAAPARADVWIKPLGGGQHSRLTLTDGINGRPAWTPDGQAVTFITDRAGNRDLYAKRSDGSGSAEAVLDLPIAVGEGFWSRDEEWVILRTGISTGDRDIVAWRSGTDPGIIVPVSASPEVDEAAPALSPDGRFLAYVSDESGRWEVWVRTFPDVEAGRWQVSLEGGTEPTWARDGRELFYKNRDSLVSVAVQLDRTFSRGEEVPLFPIAGFFNFWVHRTYDVSADGERFVMIREPESTGTELIIVENFFEELRHGGR